MAKQLVAIHARNVSIHKQLLYIYMQKAKQIFVAKTKLIVRILRHRKSSRLTAEKQMFAFVKLCIPSCTFSLHVDVYVCISLANPFRRKVDAAKTLPANFQSWRIAGG